MAKQIVFNEKCKEALQRGINAVADAVKITIGPRGRNVVLDKGYGAPTVTNDGVSIAKEIELEDRIENMGAEMVKEVASKTNSVAGDGTTTAVVLTQAISREGLRSTSLGANPLGVKLGIDKAVEDVVAALKQMAKPVKDNKNEISQVATISAESAEIGKIIADAIDKVGSSGVVTVEESQTFGVESEVVEGLQFDKGYVSPYMITNADEMKAIYDEPSILITDKKISSIKEILPLLEKMAQAGKKELIIIADDVDGEALATLVVNKIRGIFNTLAVKAPGYGDRKKEMLQDIATVTGGNVISEEVGMKLEAIDLNVLGKARKIIATKDNTTIVGGKGKKAEIDARVSQVKKQIATSDSSFDKEKLQERLAKLTGGVAVIKVGAATETEMKYKKMKIEDAVAATKAAIEEGIVSGGGAALIKAGVIALKARAKIAKVTTGFAHEFEVGYNLLIKALEAPLRQIVLNAGKEDSGMIISNIKNSTTNSGYDALNDVELPDMIKAGIIDPVKVTRTALQNAASAAATLLTADAAVAELPKKEEPQMAGGQQGMGGMGY